MKLLSAYVKGLLITLVLFTTIAMLATPKKRIKKFDLPPLDKVFVSASGERDVMHRIVYHGLFSFGKRMQDADVLIIGNSHAELGFSAAQLKQKLSAQFNRPIKVMNLGLGWGEKFPFQKMAIEHNHLQCKLILLEILGTQSDKLSVVAQPVLNENKIAAYANVIDTWLLTARDWMLDGVLPRITYNKETGLTKQRFLTYSVNFRTWKTGDSWAYWSPNAGEVYHETPAIYVSIPTRSVVKDHGDVEMLRRVVDLEFLRARGMSVITTLMPSTLADPGYYITPIKKVGLPFVDIDYSGVQLFDSYHANAAGKMLATARLYEGLTNHKDISVNDLLDLVSVCRSEKILH